MKRDLLLLFNESEYTYNVALDIMVGGVITNLPGALTGNIPFSHSVNALIEFTMTTVGDTARIEFRKQGADDCYYILFFGDGSYVLYSTIGGSVAFLSGWSVVSSREKISIISSGDNIKIYSNNILKINYTTATEFQAVESGFILYLGGAAISDLVSYKIKAL